ncbi:MAG TPA: tetratricopeptide repeat protein, partial [Ktedonobacterales bacterium]|nr:tetratricopeptide repeat protein [Ktedonobacterales bacterium]
DLRYFAGWMYQETSRWDQAAEQFSTLLDDPEYALSCFYALGQCSRAMGNLHEAAQYFDEAVDRVRLDALQQDDADQLMQLCLEAAEVHREAGDMAGAETILSALSRFVSSQGWTSQMRDVEQMQRDVLGSAPNQQQRRRRPANPSRSAIPQRNAGNRSGLGPTNAARGMPSGSPPIGGGYNAVVGGTGYQHVPGVPSGDDRLGQIIDNLSGGTAQARASAQQLPEPLRTQVARTIDDIVNYVAHGLLTPAIEECLRVMELAPQFLDIHLLLAEIYARQGKTEQAVAKYAVLIDQYQTIGRMDDVVRAYRRILQLDPNNLNYRAKLIDTLVRLGRGEEALDERIAAADSYLRLGYAERAIQEYEQALLTFPNNMQVRLGYAGALLRGGRPQHAVTELQRVLQVEPNNPRALVRLQIAVASGATTSFGSSMPGAQTSQARAAAMELLTRALRTLRMERFASYSEVVQDYLQSIELNPTNGDLRFALGQVHLAAGRAQEAQTAFQQTAQLPGMEVLGRFALAQVLVGRGDVNSATAAVQDLEDALAWARRAAPDPAVWGARPRTDGEDRQSPEVEISTLLSRAYQISGQVARGQSIAAAANAQRTQQSEVYAAIAEIGARHANPVDSLNDYHQLARHYRENRQVENAVAVLREMARVAPEEP